MSHQSLTKYRAGRRSPSVQTITRFVKGTGLILGRPVDPSELFDLGDDDAVTRIAATKCRDAKPSKTRKTYDTPLDRFLVDEKVAPADVARAAGITRQALARIRSGTQEPTAATLAPIVRALRRLTGVPVRASALFDLGHSTTKGTRAL